MSSRSKGSSRDNPLDVIFANVIVNKTVVAKKVVTESIFTESIIIENETDVIRLTFDDVKTLLEMAREFKKQKIAPSAPPRVLLLNDDSTSDDLPPPPYSKE